MEEAFSYLNEKQKRELIEKRRGLLIENIPSINSQILNKMQ